jgi:hypothetical protein
MGKSSIKRADKREGIKPGAHSMNPDRKVANQSKGKNRLSFKILGSKSRGLAFFVQPVF